MALTIEHVAFGKWKVLDGDVIIGAGLTKAEAQHIAGIAVSTPAVELAKAVEVVDGAIPTHASDGTPLSEFDRRRLSERSALAVGIPAGGDKLSNAVRSVLLVELDNDTVDYLMRTLGPAIKAGAQGVRREMRRNQRNQRIITNGAAATAPAAA